MSFEKEFHELMPHSIIIEPYTGESFRGVKTYGPPKPYEHCRIVGKGLSLRTTAQEQDTVVFDIYVDAGTDVIKIEDRLTLPADQAWLDQTPEIFAVARETDEDGHHHTKIQCGWMYHRQGQ